MGFFSAIKLEVVGMHAPETAGANKTGNRPTHSGRWFGPTNDTLIPPAEKKIWHNSNRAPLAFSVDNRPEINRLMGLLVQYSINRPIREA